MDSARGFPKVEVGQATMGGGIFDAIHDASPRSPARAPHSDGRREKSATSLGEKWQPHGYPGGTKRKK